jgi:CheY-like chemotaxis protein
MDSTRKPVTQLEQEVDAPCRRVSEGEVTVAAIRSGQVDSVGRQDADRILVIDDNRDSADSMKMLLELFGHNVEVAYAGPAALVLARSFHADVVLCDIGLPGGMDGYAVAQALRQTAGMEKAYLIALSGYGQEEDRRRSREAGFDLHLTKPIDFSGLQKALATRAPRT